MSQPNRIVVAANFTAEPVGDSLRFWARELGYQELGAEPEVEFAPYNQVFQSLLDETSLFAANTKGDNVVLVREDRLASRAEFDAAVAGFSGNLTVIWCPVPGAPSPENPATSLLRHYPVADPFDPVSEKLGDVPYTPLFFAALGTVVARAIHARRTKPFKLAALDCDNTLWTGTCGEDGPEAVQIGPDRGYLQEFMRSQRDSGMLLAISSKNNEADVDETFAVHPEMPLRPEDFVTRRIDWISKSVGLASIAQELSLGLDSFIFVDDNPKEIAEMQSACPEVLALELPAEEGEIPAFLDHVWAFDRLRVTKEDRERHDSYKQQVERGKFLKQTATLEEFIASLCLEVRIAPLTPERTARAAQLTQRTNQMNTTLLRLSEAEVRTRECLTVEVSDRFGSYGLAGEMFLSEAGEALVVDNMLLSCRALGRGVEHRMLAHAGALALERGKTRVEVPVVVGPRNQPAREFLATLPSPLTAEACAALEYRPATGAVAVTADEDSPAKPTAAPSRPPYAKIARELATPGQILAAVNAGLRAQASDSATGEQARTPLEEQIAEIWAKTLKIATPGVDQDFFDLGGHSLLAVQLFSAVRQELQTELSFDLLYSGKLTVASMAAAVELAQVDPDEMNRMMAQLEDMTDEEIQALLGAG